ncbi:uncharacterized protein LOC126836901 [Adelges cooleyi]|uniref:uncharacterized protein LOC126836901 n=1 Tax=Adelges cooleyi TaxID=133065 RepID=UPI00217F8610|nr:uncharacterized protein LOC126836901 [Adelges cooleyi]
MKTFAIIFIAMVFGRCALSDSNESGAKGDKCQPHDKINSIHPQTLLAFMSYEKDTDELKGSLSKFWNIAAQGRVSSDQADQALDLDDQFNQQFDTFYKDEAKFVAIQPKLISLQNTLFPIRQITKLSCDDDYAFQLTVVSDEDDD